MRNKFDEQLNVLNNELITMGALCEKAIAAAAKLLSKNDTELKKTVFEADRQIDQKESDIESLCIKLLMRQQPVAGDLRTISSALGMISDLERIGDQASDIAEIAKHVTVCGLQSGTHIAEMAAATTKMVTDSVDSFVRGDIALAKKVIADDDGVDVLFDKVKSEIIGTVSKDNVNAEALVDLLMIAKYFERIGDHAENVAEWVIYSITGNHKIDL